MNREQENIFTGSLVVQDSDITDPPVHNMNRFNPVKTAEKFNLGQELVKLKEESINLPPLPIDSEQLRVYVRLRPTELCDDEVAKTYRIDGGQRLYVSTSNAGATAEHELKFSHIFSGKATQQEVFFGVARPLVFNFISGDNALIFAYGCTSSGKTFTIEGTSENPGVLPRSVQTIFNHLNVIEQHRIQPARFNEFNLLSSRQAETAASEKAALFAKIQSEGKSIRFEEDASTSCIFPDLNQQSGKSSSMFLSFVEIYNNNVYDLLGATMQSSDNLGPKNSKAAKRVIGKVNQLGPREALPVGEDIAHNTYVKELRWVQVGNAHEALDLVAHAQRNMTFASTHFNMNSSRSHVICFIRLAHWTVRYDIDESGASLTGGQSYMDDQCFQTLEIEKSSVMAICDLAGSERQPPQGHQADRLREAGSINTDLLTLGQCLTGMHNNQLASRKLQSRQNPAVGAAAVVAKKKATEEPVPYRSCRLTYLLKAFLVGGRARVAMISAIVPTVELLEQNMQVLRYAAFASEVVVYRKLEQAVIDKFQKAKQKQQTRAVIKAARRLSQAPRGRIGGVLGVSKKGAVSEGTPVTDQLNKISEEMADAIDAQLVVINDKVETVSDDSDESGEFDSDDEEDEEVDEEEVDEEEDKDTKIENLLDTLKKLIKEHSDLFEQNSKLKEAFEKEELEKKRQRGYYQMTKEKYIDVMEELKELKATRPSVDECVDTEGLSKRPPSRANSSARVRPFLRKERSGLIEALGLAEPSITWQPSSNQTSAWVDESEDRLGENKRKREDDEEDPASSPSFSKKSRLETQMAGPVACALASERKNNASPSPMLINKFSTHTKSSILRLRMHQANVNKERHNAVQMKTPILHPTNPDDLSLDEALPNMPSELTRRLEQIQNLKQQLIDFEQLHEDLKVENEEYRKKIEGLPNPDKYRRQKEKITQLTSDLEFERQLNQQNCQEAENLRCETVALKSAYDTAKQTEHSLSEELVRRVQEIGRLKERINELQNDLQTLYEEVNISRADRENESIVCGEQIDSLKSRLADREQELKSIKLECALKVQELENLKVSLDKANKKLESVESERQQLFEKERARVDQGNTTGRFEDMQFNIDEISVELESAKSRAATLQNVCKTQEDKIQELEVAVNKKTAEIANLEGRIDELHLNLKEERDSFRNERDSLSRLHQGVVSKLESEIRLANENVTLKASESEALREKCDHFENLLTEFKESRLNAEQSILEKMKDLEDSNAKALDDISKKTSQILRLQAAVSEMEQVKDMNRNDFDNKYSRAVNEVEEKTAEIRSLKGKCGELEKIVSELRSNLSRAEQASDDQVKQVQGQYDEARLQLENKSDEVIQLRQKIEGMEQLKAKLVDVESKHSEALAELSEKSSEINSLTDKLKEIEELRLKLAEVESKYSQVLLDVNVKSEEIKNQESRIQELEQIVEEKAKRMKDFESAIKGMASDKEMLFEQMELERSELLVAKQREFDVVTEKIAELEGEIRNKTANYEHLSKRFTSVEAELIEARQEIDRCRSDFDAERSMFVKSCEDEASYRLEAKILEVSNLQLKLESAEKKIANQKLQISDLTEQSAEDVAKIQEAVVELRAENMGLVAKETELLQQCAAFKIEVTAAMDETVEHHKHEIIDLEKKLITLTQRLEFCYSQLRGYKMTASHAEQCAVSALEDRIKNLIEHRDAMEEVFNGRIRAVEADLTDKDSEINVLRRDRDAARDKEEQSLRLADNRKFEVDELNEKVESLTTRLESTTRRFRELSGTVSQNRNENETLRAEVDTFRDECEKLKKQIEEMAESQKNENKKETVTFNKILRELNEKKDVISQKNTRISELEQEVRRLYGNVERLESVLSTKEAQIVKFSGHQEESERPTSSSSTGKAAKSAVKSRRGPKRKPETTVEVEREPSDSEMDALVSAQLDVVGETTAEVAEETESLTKKRKRGARRLAKDEPVADTQGNELQDDSMATTTATKTKPITRARARGRRNQTQDPEENEENEEGDEASHHHSLRSNRKRAADVSKNVQSHLLPAFDANDGAYV